MWVLVPPPGLSTAPFVGLSLAFGSTIVAAPVIYYAFARQEADPTKPNTNAAVTVGTSLGLATLMTVTLLACMANSRRWRS
jgi:hypothetical protein